MLTNIFIRNFLLIERTDIDFYTGFNVITGETGAGKSVIVKAVQTCIGQPFYDNYKLNKDLDSTIAITLDNVDQSIRNELIKFGIEDCDITIRRTLTSSGRRKSFINDIPVNSSTLKQIAPMLFEIYKQNENQLLLNPEYQLQILDSLSDTPNIITEYNAVRNRYIGLKAKIEANQREKHVRERKIDNLTFEIGEIKASSVKKGEYETLKEKKLIQKNIISINNLKESILQTLYSSEDSIYSRLNSVTGDIEKLAKYLANLNIFPKKLNEFYFMIEDIVKELEISLASDDPDIHLEHIEERMNTLEKLFKKYGNNEIEVLNYLDYAEKKLNDLKNIDSDTENLKNEAKAAENQMLKLAKQISLQRTTASKKVIDLVKAKLREMCLDDAVFDINFEHFSDIGCFTSSGMDKIEFMYSPHHKVPPLPLNQITSGGELSRISLAIKSIFANKTKSHSPVAIFDEIDNGIGGEVANKIGILLKQMARQNQVIVITHLPQIAKYAERHIFIEKTIRDNYPVISTMVLDQKQKETELLRMLGGNETLKQVIK